MLRRTLLALTIASSVTAAAADGARQGEPHAYIISPADGETVSNPVTVRFGLRHMGVAPAGVDMAGTGHHHLLIDVDPPPPGQPIPADEHHRHFGGGQTETVLQLAPGKHTLRLLMGDHLHRPADPPVLSAPVTITVR
ncbi:MAG: DUF4399 domain-containing protein [Gammaproteobacteria bacterium]